MTFSAGRSLCAVSPKFTVSQSTALQGVGHENTDSVVGQVTVGLLLCTESLCHYTTIAQHAINSQPPLNAFIFYILPDTTTWDTSDQTSPLSLVPVSQKERVAMIWQLHDTDTEVGKCEVVVK